MDDYVALLADRIEGIPHPSEHGLLAGHSTLVDSLKSQFNSGRMHHAHLLVGPKGIGKATTAFRLATQILGDTGAVSENDSGRLLANPNLLYATRPYDHKDKKFKTQLTVEEVRRINEFFSSTRGADGWRVVIVDAIDDMNENSQNALLKILEEPPAESIFFLVAHRGDRVLPTIRSRSFAHAMSPLDAEQIRSVLEYFNIASTLQDGEIELVSSLANGSARSAISIIVQDGLQLFREFDALVSSPGSLDWTKVHTFAESVCLRSQENRYRLFANFAQTHLEKRATGFDGQHPDSSVLARWVEVWEKTRESLQQADLYNLDRKQVVLGFFQMIHEVTLHHRKYGTHDA